MSIQLILANVITAIRLVFLILKPFLLLKHLEAILWMHGLVSKIRVI